MWFILITIFILIIGDINVLETLITINLMSQYNYVQVVYFTIDIYYELVVSFEVKLIIVH